MQTNKTIAKDSELYKKANQFFKVAQEYWELYQKELGASAVVWIENDLGHFVLFTRSEYKSSILAQAMIESNNSTMNNPFIFDKE